ncbi:MAG: heme d1 biosynthesis radical SAM protein NirJ [Gammaproteobacteria bacterium]|nr:heme d1 biosynthesis radical SAM protein NirJ [Gammaproteobacteria bacterium]
MFRLNRYMKALVELSEKGVTVGRTSSENLPGPVVIWNLIRRCNLTCKHCYSISADTDFKGELSTEEVFNVMDDLKAFHVPVLILSGGEPLLRPDIFEISKRSKEMGFYTSLSTNGTLIGPENIEQIAEIGYDYVGISIDGMRHTHDEFRRKEGSFDAAMSGIRQCLDHGIKVGMRFTLTQDNAEDLPALLQMMDEEGIDKFYLSHLNYAGRGNKNRKDDAHHRLTRQAMEILFENCLADIREGKNREYVTGNNDADGVYLLHWARHHFPEHVEALQAVLEQWGGNSTGVNVSNIDNLGNVHPDTMWWNYDLGNVRERPFSEIWHDTTDPLMAGLKQRPRPVTGRCGSCDYLKICNGNTRVRAFQVSQDYWGEDPGCYLTDSEIHIPKSSFGNVATC